MTSGIEGNSFDRFFKITVQAWDPSGNGENDCLSRIAQTSMKNAGNADAGSWAAIEAKQKEIQEYNNKYNDEKIENADIVHEGQEVLIPLEDAIEGIRNEFETVTGEYNEAQQTIGDKTGALTSANEGVSTAFNALQTAQNEYNAVKDGDDESAKSSKLSALESAKKVYRKALEEQQNAQEELEKAQTDAEDIQDKMDELEKSLEEYTDKKEQKEDEIDQQLKDIAGNIEGLEEDLSKAQDELDKMKQELITMQEGSEAANDGAETGAKGWNQIGDEAKEALETSKNSKDNAALLGFYDEEGNLISEEDAANQDIDYDLLERGEVTDSKIIDGNRTKKYEFEDGSSAEFHKDDNGDFTKRGTRYNADGTITYPDGSVHNPETGETTPAEQTAEEQDGGAHVDMQESIEEIADVLDPYSDYKEEYKMQVVADNLKGKTSDEILQLMNEWDAQNENKNNRLQEYIAASFIEEGDSEGTYRISTSEDENAAVVREAISSALEEGGENSEQIKEWLDSEGKLKVKNSEDSEEKEYSLSEIIERDSYDRKLQEEEFAEFAQNYSNISLDDFRNGDVDTASVQESYDKFTEVNTMFDNFNALYEILSNSENLGQEYLDKAWGGTNGCSIQSDKEWLDKNGRNTQTDKAVGVYNAHIDQMRTYIELYGSEADKAKLEELGLGL